jgi:hypothetical protein
MKYLLIIILPFLILFTNCTPTTYISKTKIINIIPKDAAKWTLEECNLILEFYTGRSTGSDMLNIAPLNQKVFIRVLPLNEITIKAMARKEVIEKRLNEDDYFEILQFYLTSFTSLSYNNISKQVVEADSNYTKGYSFKVYLENISNPFEPIFLEDGYSYFFLENMEGSFSRVVEVTGLYAEDYIQLDGYLNVIITFSPFAANGKRLFENKDLNETYQLVFNGLQKDPVVLKWSFR